MAADTFDARAWLAFDMALRELLKYCPLKARMTALAFVNDLLKVSLDALDVYGIVEYEPQSYRLRSEP